MRVVRIDDYPHGNPGYDIQETRKTVRKALGIFESHRVPYLFGVTPFLMDGEDIRFLDGIVKCGQVVMHGFNHALHFKPWEDITSIWPMGGEFHNMTAWEIRESWEFGNRLLKKIGNYNPEHFIAPFNCWNQAALDGLASCGIKFLHGCSKEWETFNYKNLDYHGMTPVISPYQTLYDYAHKVNGFLGVYPDDQSQITLHWIFDKDHQGWETAYHELCDFIREEAQA